MGKNDFLILSERIVFVVDNLTCSSFLGGDLTLIRFAEKKKEFYENICQICVEVFLEGFALNLFPRSDVKATSKLVDVSLKIF